MHRKWIIPLCTEKETNCVRDVNTTEKCCGRLDVNIDLVLYHHHNHNHQQKLPPPQPFYHFYHYTTASTTITSVRNALSTYNAYLQANSCGSEVLNQCLLASAGRRYVMGWQFEICKDQHFLTHRLISYFTRYGRHQI